MKISGGSRRSDALNTVVSSITGGLAGDAGSTGCGAGAREAAKGNLGGTHVNISGGCGSEARNHSGGSHGGNSRVICTYFYRKGMLDVDVWRADLQYTQNHLSETTVRGYHYWAIPYVELMRKNSLAEKIMYPIAKYRAIELAYKMNIVEKGSLRGKLVRLVLEPICFVIGSVCKQKDWQALWQK
ncbi:hypothetical protein [Photobacterium damselae]|uniref:Uncharacterized protein n=2 Tax=Photobacterium damselae TaxID=38293 RepID=A0AAD3ZV10_PHODD|nr:hypothetical protein [Photobacterium damselae]KAB1180273.1 hypothetical protein F6450_11680 [Photobacterium damselae subsp. damselae]